MDSNSSNEGYNNLLKSYKKDYEHTNYETFVTKLLPKKHIKGSWNYSFGSGVFFTTKNMSTHYTNGVAFNMAMDVNVQKVFSSLYMFGADPKLKVPFTATNIDGPISFEENESFHYLDIGLKSGYFLIRSKKFHLAPYLSISGSYLKSNIYDEPEDNDLAYTIFNSFTYGAGLHTELMIKKFESHYPYYYGYPSDGYFSIKLEAGYSKILKYNHPGIEGDVPYILCALVLGFGSF